MSWKDKEVLTPLSFAFMSTEGAPGGWKFKDRGPMKKPDTAVSFSLSLCLSLSLSLSISLSIYLSIYLSLYIYINIYIHIFELYLFYQEVSGAAPAQRRNIPAKFRRNSGETRAKFRWAMVQLRSNSGEFPLKFRWNSGELPVSSGEIPAKFGKSVLNSWEPTNHQKAAFQHISHILWYTILWYNPLGIIYYIMILYIIIW